MACTGFEGIAKFSIINLDTAPDGPYNGGGFRESPGSTTPKKERRKRQKKPVNSNRFLCVLAERFREDEPDRRVLHGGKAVAAGKDERKRSGARLREEFSAAQTPWPH